jgi:hypothetical protein
VNNVTISEPGNAENAPGTADTWIIKQRPLKPSVAATLKSPGGGPAGKIPSLVN